VHHRAGWLNPVFESLSLVGRLGAIWVAIAIVLAVMWRRWGILALTAVSVLLAELGARGLKEVFGVERPSTRYATPKPLVHAPHDPSFPSGHAATSFAAATILTATVPRWAPAWVLVAAAIAFSRVYVGVHYPLDILGGAVLGVLIALLVLEADRRRLRAATRSG
jgi:undecaprenyl-diphosphatase